MADRKPESISFKRRTKMSKMENENKKNNVRSENKTEIPDETLENVSGGRRFTTRRMCKKCGEIYSGNCCPKCKEPADFR